MTQLLPSQPQPQSQRRPLQVPEIDEQAGVIDEVQAWYLAKAEADGWVYTTALRQIINRMYRDRDYQVKRAAEGKRTAFDWAMERDQKALAWVIRALVCFVPPDEKARGEPVRPKRVRPPRQRRTPAERAANRGKGPSWNGKPKRDWDGLDLPPREAREAPFPAER
jgi:hypothetical protein